MQTSSAHRELVASANGNNRAWWLHRRVGATGVIIACVFALVASACGSSSGGARTATIAVNDSPTTGVEPTSEPNRKMTALAGLTPAEAADQISREVTGARPLLIPNEIPENWIGGLTQPDDSTFTLGFRSPDGAKRILFAIAQPNFPTPDENTQQTQPNFHGDARSLYQVQDRRDPASPRFLMWVEKGSWVTDPALGGVPYYLTTLGLTDAEFWQIANALHPIQR